MDGRVLTVTAVVGLCPLPLAHKRLNAGLFRWLDKYILPDIIQPITSHVIALRRDQRQIRLRSLITVVS